MDWDAYFEDLCGSDTEEDQTSDLFEVNSLLISFVSSEDTEQALNRQIKKQKLLIQKKLAKPKAQLP